MLEEQHDHHGQQTQRDQVQAAQIRQPFTQQEVGNGADDRALERAYAAASDDVADAIAEAVAR